MIQGVGVACGRVGVWVSGCGRFSLNISCVFVFFYMFFLLVFVH